MLKFLRQSSTRSITNFLIKNACIQIYTIDYSYFDYFFVPERYILVEDEWFSLDVGMNSAKLYLIIFEMDLPILLTRFLDPPPIKFSRFPTTYNLDPRLLGNVE